MTSTDKAFGRRAMLTGFLGLTGLSAAAPSGAASKPDTKTNGGTDSALLTYQPITQTRAERVRFSRLVNGSRVVGNYSWEDLRPEEVRQLLSNYSQWVSVLAEKKYAGASATFVKGEMSTGDHTVVVDFLRYMTEAVYGDDGRMLGRYVVGVGLRTLCEISVQRGKVEASLVSMAAQAEMNNARGRIRFDSIGIASDEVSALMPTTVALDESAVVQAAAATAAIKGLMKEPNTQLIPHIIAIQFEPNSTDQDRMNLLQAIARSNQSACRA